MGEIFSEHQPNKVEERTSTSIRSSTNVLVSTSLSKSLLKTSGDAAPGARSASRNAATSRRSLTMFRMVSQPQRRLIGSVCAAARRMCQRDIRVLASRSGSALPTGSRSYTSNSCMRSSSGFAFQRIEEARNTLQASA